jgi:para-aminobenzoate synthetase/4-amino-4-deoxychorismate lyase
MLPADLPFPPPSGAPFVLLDDARAVGSDGGRLYRDPLEVVVARRPGEVAGALARLEALAGEGRWLAGYIAYEAGLALEPKLAPLAEARCGTDGPLLWFGAFAGCERLSGAEVAQWLDANQQGGGRGVEWGTTSIGPLEPRLSPGGYARAFAALQEAIAAGEIYQANFTFPLAGSWRGDPLALYAGLRTRGGGAHGGVVYDGSHWLLSASPELFFAMDGDGGVTLRPMKGTRPRGGTPAEDAALAAELAASAKDRAENLMIVDLMRNDLARVSVPGSVRVEAPFAVETYPSVHQMVSTVRGQLAGGIGVAALVRALFPCGSVTGAPKIRAMELLAGLERDPRGAYCGAIGRIDPRNGAGSGDRPAKDTAKYSGGAAFNVAIRTLRLTPGEGGPRNAVGGTAVMGVGSAITADSQCLPEWRECLIKGGFVHQPAPQGAPSQEAAIATFDLIETMRFTPDEGIVLLELHLERIGASARTLGFAFDRHAVRNAIQALCFEAEAPGKLRLTLGRSGATCLEISQPPTLPAGPLACAVLPLPLDAGDWRLAHKTSERALYDAGLRAARAAGGTEALLLRDDGLLTEGCFTNLFVPRDGVLLTPPAGLGLLPGVLRRHLLEEGRAAEAELRLGDLTDGFFIGNALRGLMPAVLLG